MRRLQALLDEALPADLRRHCRAGSLRDGTLALIADSPAWLSTLRYHTETLLKFFAERHTPAIRRVRWRVVHQLADPMEPRPAAGRCARRSAEAAEDLRRGAAAMSNEALRNALLRLAERLKPTAAD